MALPVLTYLNGCRFSEEWLQSFGFSKVSFICFTELTNSNKRCRHCL